MNESLSTFERLHDACSARWSELRPGKHLGSYLLTERIGRGRYSEVWEAKNMNLGPKTKAAVKIFTPFRFATEDQREAAERFYKGAVAMRQLNHDNVAKLYSDPEITDGYLWFAMKYYDEVL